jgi:hypothetical protein
MSTDGSDVSVSDTELELGPGGIGESQAAGCPRSAQVRNNVEITSEEILVVWWSGKL